MVPVFPVKESVVVVPAVGNSPNAAVSAHRLGLETALVSDLGHDKFGKECLEALRLVIGHAGEAERSIIARTVDGDGVEVVVVGLGADAEAWELALDRA